LRFCHLYIYYICHYDNYGRKGDTVMEVEVPPEHQGSEANAPRTKLCRPVSLEEAKNQGGQKMTLNMISQSSFKSGEGGVL
jgi:hypothetical protein